MSVPEYTRPSLDPFADPPPPRPGTPAFHQHLAAKRRAGIGWRDPRPIPGDVRRRSERAALEHLASHGLPGLGMDIDVVREVYRENPEYRDLAVHCAPPQV